MNKSELFKSAHKLVKSIIQTGDNYRVTFGAAIKQILKGLTMTTKTIADLLIEAGAKVWEKGTMKRVYINDAVAETVINNGILKGFSGISVGQSKFYFDLNHNVFTADNGSIRTAINSTTFDHGYKCTK